MIRRAFTAVAALAIAWLGLIVPQHVATAAPVHPELAYAYDGQCASEQFPALTCERGPPTASDNDTPYDADGHWSHGPSARPDRPAPSSITTYDDSLPLAKSAPATVTTPENVLRISLEHSSLARASVAANGVRPTVTDARLGRALADDFRGGPNPIGDGSALDAARHTVDTGQLVGGSTHLEKAVEMRDRYARILRRGGLSSADEAVAQGRYDAYSWFVTENDLDAMMRARGL